MDLVTLRSGPLGVEVSPDVGGSITRFWLERGREAVDLFRPATADAVAGRDPRGMACFPLVPYSNRIRGGRFSFRDQVVRLAANDPAERLPLHGVGWRMPWRPTQIGPASVTLEIGHAPGAWPWAFRATQRVALDDSWLTLALAVTNDSDVAMPTGLGFHPYLPRTSRTTLTARVGQVWLTDGDQLPVTLVDPPPGSDPGDGLSVDTVALDNCFVGWHGRAAVTWPERRLRLTMAADPPLGCLVVYTPPGRDVFCVEPVSHVTDAFNLAARGRTDTGMLVLNPGEAVRATVTVAVETEET
jgi:aldose 1-epimerase